jgi:AcrR family transcriptional regulator
MARPKDEVRRAELLDAVIATFADDGIGSRSLRDVAAAVGTSHRMLLHHFESREGLLVSVVEAVEARQRARLAEVYEHATDPGEAMEQLWADLVAADLRPIERLFFECYARGANGEQPVARMHPGSVTSWLSVDEGHEVDADLVRLGLAVTRGLLLDLTATDDPEGVTRAMRRYAELVAQPSSPAERTAETGPRGRS